MMRLWTGLFFAVIALLPYVAMLRLHGRTRAGAATEAEQLTIVSPHRREVRLEYSRGFAAWMAAHHGRRVSIRWLDVGGTSKILKDLETRYAVDPDRPGVDLLFGGGVAPYLTAKEQGWLTPVAPPPDAVAEIPPLCAGAPVYDPSNFWFGVALSGFGILYNRPIVERLRLPVPQGWDDLARPEYFTWVSSGDPRSSGSVHMCYEIILQAYGLTNGWDLIARICANVRNFGEAGGTGPRDVAAGEVAAGLVIDQYAQTVIDAVGGDLLVFVLPRNATVIGPDAIGLLRGAPQPELARRFLDYVFSADGQRLLCRPAGREGQQYALYRLPVLPAVYHEPYAPATRPYSYAGSFVYDDKLGSRRWNIVNDMIGTCLIEAHAELARAWKRIIVEDCPADKMRQLGRLPASMEEIEALSGRWKDARFRLETTRRWAREAQERYRRLSAGA